MPDQDTTPEIDINMLGESELEKIDAAEPEEDKPQSDTDKGETESESSSQEHSDQPKPKEESSAPSEQEPKDVAAARRAYYKEVEARKALEEKARKLELELLEAKANSIEELSNEDLDDLKSADPDAYIDYVKELNQKRLVEQQIKEHKEGAAIAAQAKLEQQLFTDIVSFCSEITGEKIEDAIPGQPLPKPLQEFIATPEYKSVSDYLDEHYFNVGRVPTKQDMINAYRVLNFDRLVAQAAAKGKEALKHNIEHAARGTSAFERAPKDPRQSMKVSFDEMTPQQQQDFIASAGEKELEEFSRWLDGK